MSQTIRYYQWLQCVSEGTFLPNNNRMNVKLVADTYVPDDAHTPADVQEYIINGVHAIVDDFFSANSMSNIIDRVKAKMEEGFSLFPTEICAEIDRIFSGERAEKLKQLIQGIGQDNHQLWQELKENGIGYFVFESVETGTGILTFCEEVSL